MNWKQNRATKLTMLLRRSGLTKTTQSLDQTLSLLIYLGVLASKSWRVRILVHCLQRSGLRA